MGAPTMVALVVDFKARGPLRLLIIDFHWKPADKFKILTFESFKIFLTLPVGIHGIYVHS